MDGEVHVPAGKRLAVIWLIDTAAEVPVQTPERKADPARRQRFRESAIGRLPIRRRPRRISLFGQWYEIPHF